MKGLILQCCGCGFSKILNLDGDSKGIESQIDETINKEGWRYAYNKKEFICLTCRKGETGDKLYNLYFGKASCRGKVESYKKLLERVEGQLEEFKRWE